MKNKISQRFSSASTSYDKVAKIQNLCATRLVSKLNQVTPGLNPQTILDVGAGTGSVSKHLQSYFPDAYYTLNDISASMLSVASHNLNAIKNIKFNVEDIESCPISKYDLIVSNLSMQWFDSYQNTVAKLFRHSEVLVFSCLLDGTFSSWRQYLKSNQIDISTMVYPVETNFINMLKGISDNVSTETKTYNLQFNTPLETVRYLKRLGANTTSKVPSVKAMRQLVALSDPCKLEYRVLFTVLR